MLIMTKYFLITVMCVAGVEGHLTDNIRKFKPTKLYVRKNKYRQRRSRSQPRIQILCSKQLYFRITNYLQQYYVKDFGIVYYMQEVDVPM